MKRIITGGLVLGGLALVGPGLGQSAPNATARVEAVGDARWSETLGLVSVGQPIPSKGAAPSGALVVSAVRAPAAPSLGSNRVEVEWKGTWYPATIIERDGERALIHYDGYDASWDEWVGPDRIRGGGGGGSGLQAGDRVLCNWKGGGTEYPGVVRSAEEGELSIDYDDGDQEVTTPDRCRREP